MTMRGTSAASKLPSRFGAVPDQEVRLDRFLPYVIHKLWAATASGRSLTLSDGVVLRTREWRVLMILAAFGPLTSAEIAQHSSMDTGSTARAVRTLLDLGMIEARTPRSDRRKQMLALTEAGARSHDEVASQRIEFAEEVLSCLSADEREQLFDLLSRVQERANLCAAPTGRLWLEEGIQQ